SGYPVGRWRESTASLLSFNGPKPATMVVIGDTQVSFTKTESKELLHWVEMGGRLVIIDRTPDMNLLPATREWTIQTLAMNFPWPELNPTDFDQMTRDARPLSPSQPTFLARNVEQIMPSRFAAAITIGRHDSSKTGNKRGSSHQQPSIERDEDDDDNFSPVTP